MCGFEKNRIFFAFFLVKNLHISKKSCNFALSFEKDMTRTPKSNPKTNKIMTRKNFEKAIANAVKNYEYASAIIRYMRLDESCANGAKLGHTNVAIVSVRDDSKAIRRWRVYYNFNTMKNKIGSINFETYSEACEEFAKFAN